MKKINPKSTTQFSNQAIRTGRRVLEGSLFIGALTAVTGAFQVSSEKISTKPPLDIPKDYKSGVLPYIPAGV